MQLDYARVIHRGYFVRRLPKYKILSAQRTVNHGVLRVEIWFSSGLRQFPEQIIIFFALCWLRFKASLADFWIRKKVKQISYTFISPRAPILGAEFNIKFSE